MYTIVKIYVFKRKKHLEILCGNESIETLLVGEYRFVEFRFETKVNATIFLNMESAEISLKEVEMLESCFDSKSSFHIVPLNELETFVKNHFER